MIGCEMPKRPLVLVLSRSKLSSVKPGSLYENEKAAGDLGPFAVDRQTSGKAHELEFVDLVGDRGVLEGDAFVQAEHAVRRRPGGQHIRPDEGGAAVVDLREGIDRVMLDHDGQVRCARRRLGCRQHPARGHAGQIVSDQQVPLQGVRLQRLLTADPAPDFIKKLTRSRDLAIDGDAVHIAFDYLKADRPIGDLLLRHHHQRQDVALGAIEGGGLVGDIEDIRKRHFLTEQVSVERFEISGSKHARSVKGDRLEDKTDGVRPGGGGELRDFLVRARLGLRLCTGAKLIFNAAGFNGRRQIGNRLSTSLNWNQGTGCHQRRHSKDRARTNRVHHSDHCHSFWTAHVSDRTSPGQFIPQDIKATPTTLRSAQQIVPSYNYADIAGTAPTSQIVKREMRNCAHFTHAPYNLATGLYPVTFKLQGYARAMINFVCGWWRLSLNLVAELQHTVRYRPTEGSDSLSFKPYPKHAARSILTLREIQPLHLRRHILGLCFLLAACTLPTSIDAQDATPGLFDAVAAFQNGHHAEAVAALEPLANRGDRRALVLLGQMAAEGLGMARDPDYAVALWRAAAEPPAPDAVALYSLGVAYERGDGVDADAGQASDFYRRSAALGFPPASYNLAVLYLEGRGVDQDAAQAFRHAVEAQLAGSQAAAPLVRQLNGRFFRQPPVSGAWQIIGFVRSPDRPRARMPADDPDRLIGARLQVGDGSFRLGNLACATPSFVTWEQDLHTLVLTATGAADPLLGVHRTLPLLLEPDDAGLTPSTGTVTAVVCNGAVQTLMLIGGTDPTLHLWMANGYLIADTWPSAQIADLQDALAVAGYNPGPADGLLGPRTLDALDAFRADRDLAAYGMLSRGLWTALAEAVGEAEVQADADPASSPP